MNAKQFEQLKERVEELDRERERNAGALEALMKRLRTEHKLPTLKAANARLHSLADRREELQGKYEKALAAFAEEFGDELI